MSPGTVVTIGNFDGVHLGHAALVRRARERAGAEGRVVVCAFDPHPLTRLHPAWAPPRLSTFEERTRKLKAAGADEVLRLEPDDDLLSMSPEAFVTQMVEAHHPSAFVEGPDFRFGHRRAGDATTLARLGRAHRFDVEVVEPVESDLSDQFLVTVSSSLIRWLIARGRVRDAARLLGRPYRIHGVVEAGDRRGRMLGVPTANIHADVMRPANGVYAGRATGPDGAWRLAAINVGRKPTFDGGEPACEAHLIDYDGSLDDYGWTTTIEFIAFLRTEERFPSAEAIAAQIRRDIQRARDLVAPDESESG